MSRYFSVRNFERWQHYRDRKPPWIKLYYDLLGDYEFSQLPDSAKFHAIAIGLLASRHDNRIPFDAKWIANRIGAKSQVDLKLLLSCGWIHDASNMLASGEQNVVVEKETEREEESTEIPNGISPSNLAKGSFEDFWLECPRKVGKGAARKAYQKAIQRGSPELVLEGMKAYSRSRAGQDEQFTAHPATWLNQDRWLDQPKATNGAVVSNGADRAELDRIGALEKANRERMGIGVH